MQIFILTFCESMTRMSRADGVVDSAKSKMNYLPSKKDGALLPNDIIATMGIKKFTFVHNDIAVCYTGKFIVYLISNIKCYNINYYYRLFIGILSIK